MIRFFLYLSISLLSFLLISCASEHENNEKIKPVSIQQTNNQFKYEIIRNHND